MDLKGRAAGSPPFAPLPRSGLAHPKPQRGAGSGASWRRGLFSPKPPVLLSLSLSCNCQREAEEIPARRQVHRSREGRAPDVARTGPGSAAARPAPGPQHLSPRPAQPNPRLLLPPPARRIHFLENQYSAFPDLRRVPSKHIGGVGSQVKRPINILITV